eukprot:TRINITY_DN11514_c0_g1_i1.p1 TRINITY_DN11514_c0_g1~~TRINITY_DN11514_c0_g1_i1.p1  ORF type:complete len:141 (-),score=31.92 TRINITY_DN11514_c0_g1_i1:63-485(-)
MSQRVFRRFVEVGRVCLINYGPLEGKICVIVDVIDENEALVDGPSSITGVSRQSIPFSRISLTDITINIPRSCRHKTLVKAFNQENVLERWAKTKWARKIASKETRANLNDFQRFQVMIAKKKRNRAVRAEQAKLLKANA